VLRWGRVPHFIKDLKKAMRPINARAETVASSGMFRGSRASRRCIVPADAFYVREAAAEGARPKASQTPVAPSWPSLSRRAVERCAAVLKTVAEYFVTMDPAGSLRVSCAADAYPLIIR
jgi:hypothetical protein